MKWRAVLVAFVAFAVVLPQMSLAAIAVDEVTLDDPALEARARSIMRGIRCLVCQNQSIEDSNALLAHELRGIVRERVAAGDDDATVRKYLVDRYGDWVLLKPPMEGRTLLLWFAPLLFLLFGGILAVRMWLRNRRGRILQTEQLSAQEESDLDAIRGGTR